MHGGGSGKETSGHRDVGTSGHQDIGTSGYRGNGTSGHRDVGTRDLECISFMGTANLSLLSCPKEFERFLWGIGFRD